MKKSNIIVDLAKSTLTVSKSFYKKASTFGSDEYKELRAAILENPGFRIVLRTSEKKSYHGLTFKVMEDYIKTQPDCDKIMVKFAAVQRIAKAKGSLYPLTKKWFLNTFPAYKVNEVAEDEAKNLTDELEAEAAAEVEAVDSDNSKENEIAA